MSPASHSSNIKPGDTFIVDNTFGFYMLVSIDDETPHQQYYPTTLLDSTNPRNSLGSKIVNYIPELQQQVHNVATIAEAKVLYPEYFI